MKTLLFCFLTVLLCSTLAHSQQLLNIASPQPAIDTAASVLGFAQTGNCSRFSFPLTMPEAEGSIQLETSGNGYLYIYSGSQAVVRFSVADCTYQDRYQIITLIADEQQGNLSKVYRIVLVPNNNYSCQYSPIIFDFGDGIEEHLYCTF